MAEENKDTTLPIEAHSQEPDQITNIQSEEKPPTQPPQQLGKQQRRKQRQADTKSNIQQKSFKTDQELNEIDQKRQRQKQAQNQRQRAHQGPKMNRQEKQVVEQFGLDNSKDFEHEVQTRLQHQPSSFNQDFMMSEHAYNISCDPEFNKLFEDYQRLAQQADMAGVIMPNLPQEDDAGPIEYKLRLTNLTLEKVRKRTTQMAFRLKEGHGLAFYQIGVHDSGQVIGLSDESILETLLVVFYMAQYLKAKLSLVTVGLAQSGHCMELKVTKAQPKHMLQPEIDSFLDGLRFLNMTRIENQKKRESDNEWFEEDAAKAQNKTNPEQVTHGPSQSPKSMQTSGFAQPQRQQQQTQLDEETKQEEDDQRQQSQTPPT